MCRAARVNPPDADNRRAKQSPPAKSQASTAVCAIDTGAPIEPLVFNVDGDYASDFMHNPTCTQTDPHSDSNGMLIGCASVGKNTE